MIRMLKRFLIVLQQLVVHLLQLNKMLLINLVVGHEILAGIWTSMKAIYPMVGASAAACAQNLKSR
jgi:hypothetical protein